MFVDDRLDMLLAKDDIDLTLPAERKCVYFLHAEDRHSLANHFLVLFLAQTIVAIENKCRESGDYDSGEPVIIVASQKIMDEMKELSRWMPFFGYIVDAVPRKVILLSNVMPY